MNRRVSGAVFYLASAILASAWYVTAALTAHSCPDLADEQMENAMQSAGFFLPAMSLLCMLMGVLELMQSTVDEHKGA